MLASGRTGRAIRWIPSAAMAWRTKKKGEIMTTLAIILKAKKEIERALEGKSNIISRALDTQEFQASQMGKALALLEVAED